MSQVDRILSENYDNLQTIKEWLSKQPHLPSHIDERFLLRFLLCCRCSLERTKRLIDLCFTIRSQAPEIFENRDPTSESMKHILNITDMVPLPKLTKDDYKLFIYRLADPDPDKYVFADALKTFLTLADVRLTFDEEVPKGEVPIFDMAGFTLKHAYKVQLPVLKKYMVYTQEAHPVRLKQIHVINVPPFLDKVLVLVKPLMKSEVSAMLHFHQPNSSTLYDYIPKELLPEEYGGDIGKLADIKKEWIQKLYNSRKFLLDDSRWKVDEAKRPIDSNHNHKMLFGVKGSFRSLEID
ncbi:hypothetical protein FQA39_LY04858 [Lamprigera yunnana]|nr:hypothetical protein FQA39_LY04858 [Lamprigera yunnana]